MPIARERGLAVIGLLVLLPAFASATTYYVDSNSGNNSANGRTPATAWKNLWMVNIGAFAPGDYILLKRGSYWNENLTVPSAGSQELPITVDTYGSGSLPVLDGSGLPLSLHTGLVWIHRPYISLNNLEICNSSRDGINVDSVNGFSISNSLVHDNQFNGIYSWNASGVLIRASRIYNNAIDTGASWAGIGVDGSASIASILIENCTIYANIGGSDVAAWNAGNGINLGNTATPPSLTGAVITGNEIFDNGNKRQNQMGRGITGAFTGEITITRNNIRNNASAGAYIGMPGQNINIVFSHNQFRNNALRQFGGFTSGAADCFDNTIVVDDPAITAMGVEVGGSGPWILTNNAFLYKAPTSDSYRGYITLNDAAQDAVFQGVNNIYYSVPGSPERWRMSNGQTLNFTQWKASGFDITSNNPVSGASLQP